MKFWNKIAASFRTRSFRVGGYSMITVAFTIAIAIAAIILVNALPDSVTRFDTTANQLSTVTDQTKTLVSGLEKDVTIYWIVRDGAEDLNLKNLLNRYQGLSSRISLIKKDPDVYPTFVQQYTDSAMDNSLIIESGSRYRYVDYYDIYVMDYMTYYSTGTQSWSFQGEQELTSAIDYVVREDLPKLYNLTGHGELALPESYLSSVEYANIVTEDLSLLTQGAVPEDADALLICAPQSDISAEELAILQTYLAGGGNLLLITDPPQNGRLTNLDTLMAAYGMQSVDGIVVEGDSGHYGLNVPFYLLPDLKVHDITNAMISDKYHVLMPVAQGLKITGTEDSSISVRELLATSDKAFSKLAGYNLSTYEKEEGDLDGPFCLAAAITHTIDDATQSNMIWVSSSSLVNEQSNAQVSGGNQKLFLNMINYLCEPEGNGIVIQAKTMDAQYLTIDNSTVTILSALVVIILPLGYLAAGIILWVRRRRK